MTDKNLIKKVKLLSGIYLRSKEKIIASLLQAEVFTILEKKRILKELDEHLKSLTNKSDTWFARNLKGAYKEGSYDVMDYLKQLGVKSVIYTQEDWDTISQLVESSQKFTHEAISGIKRNTSRVLDDLTIKRIQQIMAEDAVGTISLQEIKGDLLDYLRKKGVKIRDSAGRNWELDSYAEMMARTDLMNSYNQGVANQILHRGGDLAQIDSYAGCVCDICTKWEGKVVSITGKTIGYPKLDDAYAEGMFHPNCYDKDTEVYTENGWKLFSELKDEKIMSINPDTQEMEWVNYVNKIAYKYRGKMLEFNSNSFDLMVTPDHMMYIGTNSHTKNNKSKVKWQLVEAGTVIEKTHKELRIPKWSGKEIQSPISTLSVLQYAFLLGVYLSEGYIDKNKICICQNENRKKRFRKELLAMGFYENKNRFIKSDTEMVDHFRQFGKSYEKYIPKFFLEAKKEVLEEFLKGFVLGDGSTRETEYKGFTSQEINVFTSSNKLAGQLGELIFKIGKYPSFIKPSKPRFINFKNGGYLQKHTCWRIRVNNSKHSYYNLSPSNSHRGIQVKEVDYNGYVYDVELEKNHILLVRRNGKTAWSGNCKHNLIPYIDEFEEEETDPFANMYETQMKGLESQGYNRKRMEMKI
jgi:hypothetical protein